MVARTIDDVVYVFDENLLGLAAGMLPLRNDFAVFGRGPIDSVVPFGTLDADWISEVGRRQWTLITNDRRLRTRPHEARIALESGLKVVHLNGKVGAQSPWLQAHRLLARWASVDAHQAQSPTGPWWLSLDPSRSRSLTYQPGEPSR
jgi:hypothetical protein